MEDGKDQGQGHGPGPMYARFAGMILTSTVLMYVFTYLNTFRWNHVSFSEQRAFMTLTMAAMMAAVMLSFMLPMLTNRRVNLAIYASSALLFIAALWLVRSQVTVQDVSYMKAMIPHHSIAILTSERARISDPRVRELADEIIAAQRREISMMKTLIDDIEAHGVQEPTEGEAPLGPVHGEDPRGIPAEEDRKGALVGVFDLRGDGFGSMGASVAVVVGGQEIDETHFRKAMGNLPRLPHPEAGQASPIHLNHRTPVPPTLHRVDFVRTPEVVALQVGHDEGPSHGTDVPDDAEGIESGFEPELDQDGRSCSQADLRS